MNRVWRGISIVLMFAACTKRTNLCDSDADCKDPAYPFCDVNGEFPESGGVPNSCTIIPPECPVARCGCTPGAATCTTDQLVTCNTDGATQTTTTCSLGCSTTDARCLTFEPSNDLGSALLAAASEPDVVLPTGVHIDTGTGVITDSGGLPVAVNSIVVTQGSTAIRAFIGQSFVINDAVAVGANALAFVAPGSITLMGRLDASANGTTAGPAGQDAPAACAGSDGGLGGGGGGNATIGGSGAGELSIAIPPAPPVPGAPGGAMLAAFVPLVGGCRGGVDGSGAVGGAGGGAVQVVSASMISVASTAAIDLGAGGGQSNAGGGSGGIVVFESPQVQIQGSITANGGGGGACGVPGSDATADASPASGGGGCGKGNFVYGGAGGAALVQPGNVGEQRPPDDPGGGGGGAVGQLRVATKDGTYGSSSGSILSVAITTAMLNPQ